VNTELPEGAHIIGLDLAKKSFVGCMLTGEGFVKQQIFKGTMKRDETGWGLLKQKIKPDDLVFMEAGTASFTLARYLKAQTAARVEVLNPGMLRIIWMSQKKNDKADSIKLACIGRDMVEEAWPTISVPTEEEQAERSSITSYVFNKKIVQGAWIASKMQPNCPITKYGYRKRLNGKSKQNVAIAVANKMLRTGLALLHSGKLYSPMIAHDYERLETKLRGYKLEALMNSLPQE